MNKQYDNNVLLIVVIFLFMMAIIMIFYKTKCYVDKYDTSTNKFVDTSTNKFVDTSIQAIQEKKQNMINQVDDIYDKIQKKIGLEDNDLDMSSSDFRSINKEQIDRDIKRQLLIDTTNDFSNRLDNYISKQLVNNEFKYNYINDYLEHTKNNIDRPIYNDHVNEFIEYKKNKDLLDSKIINDDNNNLNNTNNIDNFSDSLNSSITHNTVNYSLVPKTNNDVVGEEEMLYLYPSNPDDFYGSYEILPYQYKLLDNMTIHLLPTEIKFIDKLQEKYEIKYQLVEIKKKDLPEFPTTTVELVLNNLNLNLRNPSVNTSKLSDEVIHLIQKRKSLLKDLGMTNRVYIFGNDGEYRLYNSNKTLMFNIKRTSTI